MSSGSGSGSGSTPTPTPTPSLGIGTPSKPGKPWFHQMISYPILQVLLPVILETLRILPDSIVLGTAILTALSFCKSYAIFLLAMIELMIGQRVLSTIVGSIRSLGAGKDVLEGVCHSGFLFPNAMRLSLLDTIGVPSSFPSPVMFFLSGVISYMIFAVMEFKREIQSFGGELSTRTNVATVLSSFLLFIIFAFRYVYGCETYGTLFISLLLGIIAGVAILYQNMTLFGRDSINILNLPMILTAAESGTPMYVCAPSGIR